MTYDAYAVNQPSVSTNPSIVGCGPSQRNGTAVSVEALRFFGRGNLQLIQT